MSTGNCFCPDCQLAAGGPNNTVGWHWLHFIYEGSSFLRTHGFARNLPSTPQAATLSTQTYQITPDNCWCDLSENQQLLLTIDVADLKQVGRWHVDNIKITDPSGLQKRFVVNKTGSGKPKEKWFCSECGTTLWTVPGSMNGKVKVVRLPLIENGSGYYIKLARSLLTRI